MTFKLTANRQEWPALIGSFAYFFCLLCGYYIIRPVRDEMGIQAGLASLPWLFTVVFFVMAGLMPVFGWLVSHVPRKRLLPALYIFFALNLVAFYVSMTSNPLGPFGIDSKDVAKTFYIWVTVFNLFAVSVFWSFMVDLWNKEQAKRLFGFIAAGGTLGALAGPTLTAAFVKSIGVPALLLISAGFMVVCVIIIVWLGRWGAANGAITADEEVAMGGSLWDGLKLVATKPLLLWLCALILLLACLGTVMYFEQQRLVAVAFATPAERTQFFAQLDLVTNIIVLALEIFVTPIILVRFGLLPALMILPVLTLLSFGWMSVDASLSAVAIGLVLRRAAEYALAKPAREALFASLSREEKYKAKNVIDTLVHRGGDMSGSWLTGWLKALAPTAGQSAMLALPLALGGIFAAYRLAKTHEKIEQNQR
jgi:AAA family ATP:ADP antiporter